MSDSGWYKRRVWVIDIQNIPALRLTTKREREREGQREKERERERKGAVPGGTMYQAACCAEDGSGPGLAASWKVIPRGARSGRVLPGYCKGTTMVQLGSAPGLAASWEVIPRNPLSSMPGI